MIVAVEDAGQHRASAEIMHARRRPRQRQHLGIGADSQDAPGFDGDSLRRGLVVGQGVKGGIVQDQVGAEVECEHGGRLLAGTCRDDLTVNVGKSRRIGCRRFGIAIISCCRRGLWTA
jgi:hypothetical protein